MRVLDRPASAVALKATEADRVLAYRITKDRGARFLLDGGRTRVRLSSLFVIPEPAKFDPSLALTYRLSLVVTSGDRELLHSDAIADAHRPISLGKRVSSRAAHCSAITNGVRKAGRFISSQKEMGLTAARPSRRGPRLNEPIPTAARKTSTVRRTITVEFDGAGWESCSDESLRRLVCKALTSCRYRKPTQNAMRIEKLKWPATIILAAGDSRHRDEPRVGAPTWDDPARRVRCNKVRPACNGVCGCLLAGRPVFEDGKAIE